MPAPGQTSGPPRAIPTIDTSCGAHLEREPPGALVGRPQPTLRSPPRRAAVCTIPCARERTLDARTPPTGVRRHATSHPPGPASDGARSAGGRQLGPRAKEEAEPRALLEAGHEGVPLVEDLRAARTSWRGPTLHGGTRRNMRNGLKQSRWRQISVNIASSKCVCVCKEACGR